MYFLRYSKLNALVTILTLCKDCVWCNHSNKPLLSKAENHACNSQLWTSATLKLLKLWDQKYCIEVPLYGFTSLPNLIKIDQVVQNLMEDRHTHIMVIS
jgi:hypothetical protein